MIRTLNVSLILFRCWHVPGVSGWLVLACIGWLAACTPATLQDSAERIGAGRFVPADGKRLLVIGQDLESIRGYVQSGRFPIPGGVTAYTNIYDLRDPAKLYAGIGLDNNLEPVAADGDWGAGLVNTWKMVQENPDSALVLGLDITHGPSISGLAGIIRAEYDAEINKLAAFITKTGRQVFLRIGYEFDGNWNRGYENSSNYKAAWRYIVDRMRAHKVRNVAYVWHGASSPADESIEGYHEDITEWYPGDAYVDWIGYSWFLRPDEHGTNPASTRSQSQLTNELVEFARSRYKPVMVAEASPQGYFIERKVNANIGGVIDGPAGEALVTKSSEEIWQEWYAPFFRYVNANSDVIRAVAYINCHWDAQKRWGAPYHEGLWGDSRIESDSELTSLWLEQISKPDWVHGVTR